MYTHRTLNISLIDDDSQMREMLTDFLKDKYPLSIISSFSSGEEALKKIVTPQDIIILDYHLDSVDKKAMNGIQVLKTLKERFPHVPIIFLSGQEKIEVAAHTMQYGAWDYILKNESAFQRLEIHINNILGHVDLKKQVGTQKFFNRLLGIVTIALIIGIILMRIF